MTMSAKCPSRRNSTGVPNSVCARTTWPSSTTVLLPGSVLAGTGVEANLASQLSSRFGKPMRMAIGSRSSPRCE